jgi:hypothetical protein
MGYYLNLAKSVPRGGASQPATELRSASETFSARRDILSGDGLASCGLPHCAGCYQVDPGVRIHPPKSGEDWKEWLLKWEPKGRVQ